MTDTNQLPPLPTLQPGDYHMESLIEAAIQWHADTRDAMRWLVRQIVPATQLAEVTDELAAFEAEMRCECVWCRRSLKKRPDGRYQNWQVDLMWEVWKARAQVHPAQAGVTDDVVRDAQRLDWLARNPVDALDVFGKSRPDEARFIRATIDAAMTAAQAQKGQP